MALQVWLPLTQDTRNQGLSDLSFSIINSTNTVVDTNGKLGKCYTNDSHTAGGLISNKILDLGQQQSMFCWFKFTHLMSGSSLGGNLVSQHRYEANQGLGISIRYVSSTTGYLSVNTGNGSSRTYNTYYGTTLLQANTWYHGGFTYDNGIMKIYVNGICEKTVDIGTQVVPADYLMAFCWSTTGTSGSEVSSNYRLQGSLNDVRIYNHCLSPMEVKELSKGLVLHYPLNRGGWGQENLLSVTPKSYVSANYLAYQFTLLENLVANQTYTIQFWDVDVAHSAKSTADLGIDVYWGGGSLRMIYWHGTSYFTNGHADYLVGTFTVTSTQASGSGSANLWLNIYNSVSNADGTRSMSIGKWKLEKDSIATPWCPNSSDALATTMGFNDSIEYDISGYCNNLNNFTNITYSSDTPKYSVSTFLSGSTYGSHNNFYSSDSYQNAMTVACWVKRTFSDATERFITNSWVRLYTYTDFGIRLTWTMSTGSTDTTNTWASSQILPLDEWTHVCFTMQDGIVKCYINGVLKNTSDRTQYGTYIHGVIGNGFGGSSASTKQWIGGLSDFRFYATALSADDVKSLYQNSAYIDSSGNVYGAIYEEG